MKLTARLRKVDYTVHTVHTHTAHTHKRVHPHICVAALEMKAESLRAETVTTHSIQCVCVSVCVCVCVVGLLRVFVLFKDVHESC